LGIENNIWSDDGVWVTEGADVITTNLGETIYFEPGLPFDREPNEDGIAWLRAIGSRDR
jgi:hypothetical protein